jgi:uncharacterized phage protein gp47/JayE
LSYLAPYISPAGLVVPTYPDILNYLLNGYRSIYGQTVYLGTDTQKYQELSIYALMDYDTLLALQLVYNQRGPLTAIGSGLDSILKLNGLARKIASFSTAPGLVTGQGGTTITLGTAVDKSGNTWALPSPVTIPGGGSVVVALTCLTAGAIGAQPGDIDQIGAGATGGWTGITNPSAASPGLPVEQDSQARGRQSFSVALPSRTMLDGTIAAIAATSGVTRYAVHENFTGAVDSDDTPPHSISAVVEGGTDQAVATAIFLNRGIGADMNGTSTYDYVDPVTAVTTPVSFSRPTYVQLYVSLSLTQLQGYTSATEDAIAAALLAYLNGLQIGQIVTRSALFAVAMSVMPSFLTPIFAIETLTLGTAPTPTGTADIAMAYNQVAQSASNQIVISGG